ncbi:ATP synthase subunit a [Iodidimonas gelatinilytica]|uniref:ATP synthase subunit a n=1 Tax=Iodidimonas gelatinilytica TaxID=1236966 RepID=A0A5A7MQV5_9PROT|nr:F0F1 ATP synthase subunit A [Iodidimonas gelatinilytica]GEQ98004.1 ATP synthase subunit a [Iodidimonas gelatinilytica]GEQ99878.1 ATP synthase subunit a [Iodidimonas gelatinilytica]
MANPLEQFEIHPAAPLSIAGVDASLTNAGIFMLISSLSVAVFVLMGVRRSNVVPGRWQSMVELCYEFIAGMVKENIGQKGRAYVPFVFTLFMFILAGNLIGLLPYSFTVTSHLAVTFAFAGLIFLATIVIGFINHGAHFLGMFVPKDTPILLMPLIIVIEVISFLSRPITHSVRLFANMTAGHILLKVFAGFIVSLLLAGGVLSGISVLPALMIVILNALELLVAVVQAYVFALLTCVYLNDAVNLEH